MAKCGTVGKVKFPNQMEAQLAIANIAKSAALHPKQKYREVPTRAYACKFCKGWHLTSQAKNQ